MAHLMKSVPRDKSLPVIWNVDASVGPPSISTNLPEDVFLVQYMLKLISMSPLPMPEATRKLLAALTPSGSCDPYTMGCIKYLQDYMKQKFYPTMTADGRVSKATPALRYGANTYFITAINQHYRSCYFVNWPCISMDGDCSAITDLVFRELYGTTAP